MSDRETDRQTDRRRVTHNVLDGRKSECVANIMAIDTWMDHKRCVTREPFDLLCFVTYLLQVRVRS